MNSQNLSRKLMLTLVIVGVGSASVHAQGESRSGSPGRGFPSAEETFRRMDRNGNNAIDPEEWETLPAPIRRAYEDLADLSRPMEYDDFVDLAQRMREQMMSRFGGGRDFGRGGRSRDEFNAEPPIEEGEAPPRRSRRRFSGGEDSGSGREGNSSDESSAESGGKKTEKSPPKASKPRPSINVKLPEQYRAYDKDRDGQIGLYEWSRSDYPGFRKLDRNGDGFLTPHELIRAAAVTAAAASVAPAAAPRAAGNSSGNQTATVAPASTAVAPKNPAETAFNLIDKDKDGSLSEVEWGKSILASKKFKDAGIEVRFPISRVRFYEQYPLAYPPKGN
jgi:Ca2+-binding EF-hand superfamily protein